MEVLLLLWVFLLGLVFGSFFNVVIYRLPRQMSLLRPGSACPHCGHRLTVSELVPVLSFLWQKGRCRECRGQISWRYPLVEFVTGSGFVAIALKQSTIPEVMAGLVFFSLLAVLALIDLEHKVLPNALTVPGIILGLLFALLGWTTPFGTSVIGAATGFLLIFVIALLSRGGMGMGDAKLMSMIGAFLGWKSVFFVLFGASLLGSIVGIIHLYLTKQGRRTPLPFGPFLATAALVIYFMA